MKLQQLKYLLWFCLIIFGSFYVTGTLIQDSLLHTFTDLWANLFASLVVLLVIEHIIKQSRIKEMEPSKRYIHREIRNTLTSLITSLRPPRNWEIRLEGEKDWNDYYGQLLQVRKIALEKLENILLTPPPLLDSMRNDITSVVEELNSFSWRMIGNRPINDKLALYDAASQAVTAISLSLEAMKKHDLLNISGNTLTFREGEAPKKEPSKGVINTELSYSYYKKCLDMSIEFRDASYRKVFPKEGS